MTNSKMFRWLAALLALALLAAACGSDDDDDGATDDESTETEAGESDDVVAAGEEAEGDVDTEVEATDVERVQGGEIAVGLEAEIVGMRPWEDTCGSPCYNIFVSMYDKRGDSISQPGDSLEREADSLSARILSIGQVEPAQRRPVKDPEAGPVAGVAPVGGDLLPSAGQPLDDASRRFFEPRFGHDLGKVRIHADRQAAALADSVDARAFTLGRDIVFGWNEFQPHTPSGRELIAHELVHTVQATSEPTILRKGPSKTGYKIKDFQFQKGEQKQGGSGFTGFADLKFDEATNVLTCTLLAFGKYDKSWSSTRRKKWEASFEKTVKDAWDGKHKLVEYSSNPFNPKRWEKTGRTASVQIFIKWSVQPEFSDSMKEIEYIQNLPPAERDKRMRSFKVHVSPTPVRDRVVAGQDLYTDATASQAETTETANYRNYGKPKTVTNENMADYMAGGRYGHYKDAGIKLTVPGRKSFQQRTAAHEFGHMIGLADEYVLSREDYKDLKGRVGTTKAEAQLKERSKVSGDIMNVGMNVRKDHYRPFALMLTSLMHPIQTTWVVEGDQP